MTAQRKSYDSPGIFAGLLVIAIGVIFLLDRNGIVEARVLFRFWPAVLIAAGVGKLAQARETPPRIWGVTLVTVGSILLSNSLGYTHVGFGDIWPLFIIAAGATMLWRAMEGGHRFGCTNQQGSDDVRMPGSRWSSATRLNHWAVFSGFERKVTTRDFEGGELCAIFGGSQIDLRRAELKNGTAVLDATAIFGGIEIRVPETWEVVLRGTGVFGGYSDSTHPLPDPAARTGTLWVRGAAVFGGVEIKN